jgi:hypothetical protein
MQITNIFSSKIINTGVLNDLIQYILESEEQSFEEYIDDGSNPENHIYSKAKQLQDIINKL